MWKKRTGKSRAEWGRDGGADILRRCREGEKGEKTGGAFSPVTKNGG
jgi:hypothetical protein